MFEFRFAVSEFATRVFDTLWLWPHFALFIHRKVLAVSSFWPFLFLIGFWSGDFHFEVIQLFNRTLFSFQWLHLVLPQSFDRDGPLWRWAVPAVETKSQLQLCVGRSSVWHSLSSNPFSANLFGFLVWIQLRCIIQFLAFGHLFYAIKIKSELCFRGFCCSFWEFRCKTCANRRSSGLFCLGH